MNNNIQFPLNFTFKISTFSNDFIIKDADNNTISFVKQKLFKLIEEVNVFNNETKSELLYTIKANKWIDFSAAYAFTNSLNIPLGSIARKGWASLWKARYEILDENTTVEFEIQEENAWVKVADGILSEIPVLGLFTGYFLNPTYKVIRPDGLIVARLKKESSFFGREFSVSKLESLEKAEQERVILSLMMMILLERRRG